MKVSSRLTARFSIVIVGVVCMAVWGAACRTDDILSTHIQFSQYWIVSDVDDGNGAYAAADPVVVPTTATVGVPFSVRIYSFSGGCTSATDSVSVSIQGTSALLIPYDHVLGSLKPNSACTADLRWGSRVVQITFAQAGPATIVVRGWRSGPPAGLFDLSRSTMVNP